MDQQIILENEKRLKWAEEDLQMSEEKFMSISDSVHEAILIMDNQGNISYWNNAAEKIFGYSAQEALGKKLHTFLVPQRYQAAYRKGFCKFKMTGQGPAIRKTLEFEATRKDGTEIPIELSISAKKFKGERYAVGIIRDITECKRAEEELRESEIKFRMIFQNVTDVITYVSRYGKILDVNGRVEELFGYKPDELIGKNFAKIGVLGLKDLPRIVKLFKDTIKGGKAKSIVELELKHKNGNKVFVEVRTSIIKKKGKVEAVVNIFRNITELKRADEHILTQNAITNAINKVFKRALICKNDREVAHTCLAVAEELTDSKFGFIGEVNQSGYFDTIALSNPGWDACTISKTNAVSMIKDMEIRGLWGKIIKEEKTLIVNDPSSHPESVGTPEGHPSIISFLGVPLKQGDKTIGMIGLANKTSGYGKSDQEAVETLAVSFVEALMRKRAEVKLRESEELYRDLVEKAGIAILIDEKEGNFKYVNERLAKMLGYSLEEMKKQSIRSIVHPNDVEMAIKYHKARLEGKKTPSRYEFKGIKKDGSTIYLEVDVITLKEGKNIVGTRSYLWDITQRKLVEEVLQESERKYRVLFECANDAVFLLNSEQRPLAVNKKAADMLGYSIEELINLSSKDIVVPSEYEAFQGKFKSIWEGKSFPPYERIFRKKDGTEFPVEINAALMRDKERRPQYVQNIVRDITERKRVENELKQTSEKLRQSLGGIVKVVASTVELRDPYTAGHQRRVADLACAIATEMVHSKDRIEGIQMAGIIHDIGKISIPAEILSKPGSLSETEFSLIKEHSKTGYDLLKNVEFPWPIAQIVLQHHERIDGSGYPQGLSGEDILLEARILGIADVVEAISSHRPYRPALGIDSGLEQISENRGVLYDPEIVDACIKVISEKKYEFEKQSRNSL